MANRVSSPEELFYPAIGLAQNAYAAGGNGSAIDARGFSHVSVVIPTLTVVSNPIITVQHSLDGSTGWAAIAGATVTLSNGDNGTNVLGQVRLAGKRRYIRISIDAGGTFTGGVTCLMFGPDSSSDLVGTLAFNVA